MAIVGLDHHEISYEMAVSLGKVPGQSVLTIRGRNESVPGNGTFVDVCGGGEIAYLATAERMNLASTSAQDNPAGTGIGVVVVDGVDNSGVSISEAVTLNGTSNVLTVQSFLRVNFLIGAAPVVGSNEMNVGTITATAETAGSVQQQMEPDASISQGSPYTVPLGFTLAVTKVEINVAREGGGQDPLVVFRGYSRPSPAHPFIQVFDKRVDAAVQNEIQVLLPFPEAQPTERSDILLRANSTVNDTEVRTRLYGILIANG